LEETGIQILRSPIDMPWGERIAYVSDPDGNPVALASEVPVVPVAPDATR
ncbi:VOC family protein, partial [Nocardia salmonicida]